MSVFPTSFLVIQNAHDEAVFARHAAGGDLASITITGTSIITVNGLVDNEQDAQQFEFGSIPVRETKVIHVLGPDLVSNAVPPVPYVFGIDFDIGNAVSINGDGKWQLQSCIQSADGGNMLDLTVIAIGDGE